MHFPEACREALRASEHVQISESQAMHIAKSVRPEECCATMAGGKVCAFGRTKEYCLERCGGAEVQCFLIAKAESGSRAFFNFMIRKWQPESEKTFYIDHPTLLYVAFAPRESRLFAKMGFEEHIPEFSEDKLISYVENKRGVLQITDVDGHDM